MKSIAFDARMVDHPGIGRYIRELLHALIPANHHFRFVLLGPDNLREVFKNTAGLVEFRKVTSKIYSLEEQFAVPRAANDCDALHVPHFNIPVFWNKKLLVTVHDLTYLHDSGASGFGMAGHYARYFLSVIKKKADAIVAVSEYTKKDLMNTFRDLNASKIFTIPEAASPRFVKIQDARMLETVRQKFELRAPFILFVGSLRPHKNLPALIRAFLKLKAAKGIPHELVLVGKRDPRHRQIDGWIRQSSSIRYLGQVPDEELVLLYNAAEVFVLPSWFEGFGLPAVEAMACGTPVIVSNRTSLPEIVGDAGVLFDPDQVDALEQALYNVLESRDLRRKMSEQGLKRSHLFSWKNSAESTLRVYKKALG